MKHIVRRFGYENESHTKWIFGYESEGSWGIWQCLYDIGWWVEILGMKGVDKNIYIYIIPWSKS